jgi:putative phosphoribosyl transferase
MPALIVAQPVQVRAGRIALPADLAVPDHPRGVVVFAHGSGSSRRSPRNQRVAASLHHRRFATLLMDLLTDEEERVDGRTRELRFDMPLLAGRLTGAIDWLSRHQATAGLPLGAFGASTGAAAALIAAAERPDEVRAVVSRGGRPDLAGDALPRVLAPVLLIVGGADTAVVGLNEQAARRLAHAELSLVAGATHLFDEPGALEQVMRLAADWLSRWLPEPGAPVADSAQQ